MLWRENVSYTLSGGISLGSTFGVILVLESMISLRSISSTTEISGESRINGTVDEFVEKLSSNLMLVSVGFSFLGGGVRLLILAINIFTISLTFGAELKLSR